jgi:hypothetical protein
MKPLPNFIKRKRTQERERKRSKGAKGFFSSLSVKNRVLVRQTRHGHQRSGDKIIFRDYFGHTHCIQS